MIFSENRNPHSGIMPWLSGASKIGSIAYRQRKLHARRRDLSALAAGHPAILPKDGHYAASS
ncbi:hypothetical protein X742_24140 [Mesorhizobium sp. LNHC232B00]|nr:hypothetical protein X742_24140 [Mesorhizobium sp. LNHC232B00]